MIEILKNKVRDTLTMNDDDLIALTDYFQDRVEEYKGYINSFKYNPWL